MTSMQLEFRPHRPAFHVDICVAGGFIFRPLARRLAFHVGLYHGLAFKPLSLCADYG